MKKLLTSALLSLLLTGCFGEPTFDATDEASVKESANKIANSLPPEQQEDFSKAIMYFSMGGSEGLEAMMAAKFAGNQTTQDTLTAINIKKIHGLTGQEILSLFETSVAADKAKADEKARKEEAKRAAQQAEYEKQRAAEQAAHEKQMAEFERQRAEAMAAEQKRQAAQLAKLKAEQAAREEAKAKLLQAQQAYMPKVKVLDFEARRINTYLDKGIPAVRFMVENSGKRTLNKVKVEVTFYDAEGKAIYEQEYYPVLVNDYTYSNKPLKAGRRVEMEKDKYYTLEQPLTQWDTGKADIKVVEIAFAD